MKNWASACLGLAILFVQSAASAAEPVDVWLDVDTSTGVLRERPRDVDDGLAMIQSFNSPEIIVRGVSTCFGNANLDEATQIAQDIIQRFGPPSLPVHPGAAAPEDARNDLAAIRAMADELKQRRLTILALGPVTNVAGLLKQHPELAERIDSVVVVAGRRPGFNFHPPGRPELIFPDANFEKDVDGMQVLLDSKVPIVFAGYEVSSDVWLKRSDLEKLATQSEFGRWVSTTSEYWLARWEQRYGFSGFNPFDSLAVVYVTHPNLINAIPVDVHITSGPNDRAAGRLPATRPSKAYLIAEPTRKDKSLYTYCVAAKDEFIPLLVSRLAGRSAGEQK
ncbi:MAG TPA: nucleoside hydrolase [Tepidisphaeraceae bacterium]|jgi:pyrimidine-specific ribonucleoside hydrolase